MRLGSPAEMTFVMFGRGLEEAVGGQHVVAYIAVILGILSM